MTLVEGHGLPGEQVQRNRVAIEGINHEHVEVLCRLRYERCAGIPLDDAGGRRGLPNIGEQAMRDDRNRRVNFVKRDAVARIAVGSDGSSTEANDADVAGSTGTALVECETDA